MDNKYIPPDNDGAVRAFQQTALYTEALWKNEFNRDEKNVRTYTLPEIKSRTVEEWENTLACIVNFLELQHPKFRISAHKRGRKILGRMKKKCLENVKKFFRKEYGK